MKQQILCLDGLSILGLLLRFLTNNSGNLDLLVFTNLIWLGSAQFKVLGDLLGDRLLLAHSLGLLLALDGVSKVSSVSLGLSLVVKSGSMMIDG